MSRFNTAAPGHHAPGQNKTKSRSQRQLRVGEEMRHILADILRRESFHDADLLDITVTVSEVRVSPDMKNATCFVMPLAGTKLVETVAALNRVQPFLRSRVAAQMQLRHVPALHFVVDDTFNVAAKMNEIFSQPQVQQDLHQTSENPAPENPENPDNETA